VAQRTSKGRHVLDRTDKEILDWRKGEVLEGKKKTRTGKREIISKDHLTNPDEKKQNGPSTNQLEESSEGSQLSTTCIKKTSRGRMVAELKGTRNLI